MFGQVSILKRFSKYTKLFPYHKLLTRADGYTTAKDVYTAVMCAFMLRTSAA